jgi:glycine cleavage system H protein
VTEVNAELSGAPELINDDPYGQGWLVRVKLSDPSQAGELLDVGAYRQLLS